MGSQFVTIHGFKIKVKGDLSLTYSNIDDISDVKGLESLVNLRELNLDENQMKIRLQRSRA